MPPPHSRRRAGEACPAVCRPGEIAAGFAGPREPGDSIDRPQSVTVQSSRAIGLIGPGRAGVGLALALARAGYAVSLHGRKKKNLPAPLTLTVGAGGDGGKPPPWIAEADVVILAVRDDAITPLPTSLAKARVITERHVVLHLSGVQGQEALGPLVSSRAGLGSLHPLQTIVEPELAPDRLTGAS